MVRNRCLLGALHLSWDPGLRGILKTWARIGAGWVTGRKQTGAGVRGHTTGSNGSSCHYGWLVTEANESTDWHTSHPSIQFLAFLFMALSKTSSNVLIGSMRRTCQANPRVPTWSLIGLARGSKPCSSRPQQMSRRIDIQVPSTTGTAVSDDFEAAGAATKVSL